MRLAILDDYQNVALEMADWGAVAKDVEIEVFNDHISDEDEIAARLRDFEIVVIMRERTPFTRTLFEKLPNLKLLVTSGMRNRGIDTVAATSRESEESIRRVFSTDSSRESLRSSLLNRKVMGRLVEIMLGEDGAKSAEDETEPPEDANGDAEADPGETAAPDPDPEQEGADPNAS